MDFDGPPVVRYVWSRVERANHRNDEEPGFLVGLTTGGLLQGLPSTPPPTGYQHSATERGSVERIKRTRSSSSSSNSFTVIRGTLGV